MTLKRRFDRLSLVLIMSAIGLFLAPVCNSHAAQNSIFSLITDTHTGPAARHGASKVRLALREKGIETEQVASLQTARGSTLIVSGISDGPGAAAALLTRRNIA
ncbi:MAG: hypothetical protein ACYS0H_18795 [Planctomycetota bacterium]|jgi:hypothetical protein